MNRACERCGKENTAEAKFCLFCGAMLETASTGSGDPFIGKILLGRYRVVRILGEGGMGKVYLAEQKMGTAIRNVAIKTLLKELTTDPQLIARFHRECETVIQLTHPNTIDFYDFGDLEDGTLFIVMEYIQGESLAAVLQRGPIDPARADKLLIQICGSLQEAHQRGIVHRDLKPENVLLTNRGGQTDFVKVLDFGIAKRNEAEDQGQSRLTKQGMVLGTPPYMSPEQFSGQTLDARSDIYSLGIMTYEMLTGKLPFEANTPWEWATQHLTAQPRAFETFPTGSLLAPHKREAILRALHKSRDARYANVLEFLQQFTGYQNIDAAWTMATSGSNLSPRASSTPAGAYATSPPVSGMATPTGGQPRPPLGTPGPLPSAGFGTAPTALSTPSAGLPSNGGMAAPAGYASQAGAAGYPSGTMTVPTSSGGKIVAIILGLLLVLGGGLAAAWFMFADSGAQMLAQVHPDAGPSTLGNTLDAAPPLPPVPDAGQAPTIPVAPDPPDVGSTKGTAPDEDATGTNDDANEEEAPPRNDPEPREKAAGPSARDLNLAGNLVNKAQTMLNANNVEGAVNTLAEAQRLLGPRHPLFHPMRRALTTKGSNMVGLLIQKGDCSGAQAMYRLLRRVGAERGANRQFGDWCRKP